MSHITSTTSKVIASIQTAFSDVKLEDGISLLQAEAIDNYREGVTELQFRALKNLEVVNDWSQVPFSELERGNVSHLNAAGFRYYLPALMLSILKHYDSSSMRVIGTLSALYPKKDSWDYHMHRYALLTIDQKNSIALFLSSLPELVLIEPEDIKMTERAINNYWHEFIPATNSTEN